MNFIDKILDVVNIGDDYDDDEEFLEDEEMAELEEVSNKKGGFFSKKKFGGKNSNRDDAFDDLESKETSVKSSDSQVPRMSSRPATRPAVNSKVTPIRRKSSQTASGGMEVCVIKPTKVEDYREIADTLLSGCTVVLNLEGNDVDDAQRIIDLSSGSCYAIGGGLQKVSSYIFILTPSNVEISGDIQDLLNGAVPSMRTSF